MTRYPAGWQCITPEWHQGVVGILASRIKERFHRPVIAFAPAGDGTLKGSGRSIQGLHMRDALERLDTLYHWHDAEVWRSCDGGGFVAGRG